MEGERKIRFDYDGENFTMKMDDRELVGCQWVPQSGVIKFVLIFFHGLGAFVAINRSYFPYIVECGGVILGTDHFGHGRSPGDRGLTSTELLGEEIGLLIRRANILFPDVPLFLYGHSMGGLASLCFVMSQRREAEKLDGIIIEAPWLNDTDEVSSSIPINIIGRFGRFLFPTAVIDTGSGIDKTHYPKEFIDSYTKCKLPHDYITPRLYASSFEMRKVVQQLENWPPHLRLLFMQGALDASVGIDKNLKWAEALRDLHPQLVRLVYHNAAEHAMLRNECGPTVLREVVDFITWCLD